jgi:phosphate-selective porin OprO and OprP
LTHLLLVALLAQAPAAPRVSFSGFIQPQYELRTVERDTRDRVLFRRLFVALDAQGPKDWRAQFQIDAGALVSSGDRPVIKNAYIQYGGWSAHGLTLTIGNQKMPLSRSLLLSSQRRGLIERPFTGDRAYGSPGRAPAVKVDGFHRHRHLYWSAAVAETRQVPNPDEVRIDGPAESGSSGNQGPIVAGRVELHPRGETIRDQADLNGGPWRFTVGGAAYRWWNDDDVAPHGAGTVDASRVTAVEVSGALRGGGFSVDAEYERVGADALATDTTLGLYRNGHARLHKASVEGGYMLIPRRMEALASYDILDSLSFTEHWQRAAAGMNWYVNGHDMKVSLMHRESFNERGVSGARSHTTYIQTQFAF